MYQLLRFSGVNVSHKDYGGLGKSVPFVVEVLESTGANLAYVIFGTERNASAVTPDTDFQIIKSIPRVVTPEFLYDDALFGFHLVFRQFHICQPVLHNQESVVQVGLFLGRDGEHINGPVVAGVGIDAYAVLGSHRLKTVHEFMPGEMTGTSESHMLQKMCCTPVRGVLQDGPGPEYQAAFHHIRRGSIMHKHITQSIVQLPAYHPGRGQDFVLQGGLGHEGRCEQQSC